MLAYRLARSVWGTGKWINADRCNCFPHGSSRTTATSGNEVPRARLCFALVADPIAMQVVAVGIEPGLGALDMAADPGDHPPESRRMIHLDQMRHLMGGEIVHHIGRREDQPPRERQRARRGAGPPAARLVADRQPLDPDAERLRVSLRRLL